jgi:signal transduction protein with GAF and PtsI domain
VTLIAPEVLPPARSVEEVYAAFDLIFSEIRVVSRAIHGSEKRLEVGASIKVLTLLRDSLIASKKELGV